MSHPPAHALDAVAAGDADPAVAEHLSSCASCAAYVEALRSEAAAFRASANADAFAEKVSARAAAAKPGPKRLANVYYLFPPILVAAAALVLLVRAPKDPGRVSSRDTPASVDPARFKGEMVLAVIRERDGRQERLQGPFSIRPFDRVRVELGVDRVTPVTAGLLSADGTWTLLLAPTALEAGTHYSELSARFDASPTDAVLLVGPPEAVDTARRTRRYDGVLAWGVTSERR